MGKKLRRSCWREEFVPRPPSGARRVRLSPRHPSGAWERVTSDDESLGPVADGLETRFLPFGDWQAHFFEQELHVFPDEFFGGRVQQIRRVVGDEDFAVAIFVEAAAELADGFGGFEEGLGGDGADADDVFGAEDFELLLEEGAALGGCFGRRIAVWAGGIVDVEDVDALARPAAASMILVRSCPARPTKGSPWRSSSAPAASPKKATRARGLPTPKTVCLRVVASSRQSWQGFTSASACPRVFGAGGVCR